MPVDVIQNALNNVPSCSGVYKMYDINNTLVYIGKAKNLYKRLQSYTKDDLTPKTTVLVQVIRSIEFEITQNENQALILEASLIKKHQPKYNILLKDDKSRVYIKLSNHKFPAITKYRGKFERKSRLFGPFGYVQGSKLTVNDTIKSIISYVNKVFKIRSCKDTKFNIHKACGKPCMEFQIKTCSGPCAGMILHADYERSVQDATMFLQGSHSNLQKNIKERINDLAQNQEFAEAGLLKKQLLVIESLKVSSNEVNFSKFDNIDIIVLNNTLDKIEVFGIRNGYALGGNLFDINKQEDKTPEEILEAFLYEYYSMVNLPPKIIFVSHAVNVQNVKMVFKELFSTTADISNPKRGENKTFIDFVSANLEFQSEFQKKQDDEFQKGMEFLKETFGLVCIPNRVEIYDNSHISGVFFTGAFVVASQNGFEKNEYRKFNARIAKGGDDYAMMREVIMRRFSKDSTIKEMPDLLIIDGGLGQFNSVIAVLDELKIKIPVVAIAKGRDRNAGNETFFTRHNTEGFKINNKKALYFIERLRDEAHRFVITSHRKRREKL
jgi:excinuclease ABC subunit C